MYDPSSRRLSLAAFIAGITTVCFLVVLGFFQWDAARWEKAVRTDVQTSTERARDVSDYLSALRDIETGQRGYILTADPAYLQPYEKGARELPDLTRKIRAAAQTTGLNRDLSSLLLATGAARAKRAAENVEMIKKGRREEARARIAEGTGKRLMDGARAISARIEKAESDTSSRVLSGSLAERRDRQRKIYAMEIASLLNLAILLFCLSKIVQRLKASSATLRDAARRQAAIYEGATDAMMMLDRDGTIESVNRAAETLFGYDRGQLVGRSNLYLFRNAPSIEASRSYLQNLASGKTGESRQMFEGSRGDGTPIDVEVVTTPIRLGDGLHFLAVARDATERRVVEKMKDEFVATVSHELRTPLTSVAGSLGLILGGAAGEISEKASRLVQIAYNNCNRLIRLINDMLDIEKIESGKAPLQLQTINAGQGISQVVSTLSSYADQHGVFLVTDGIDPSLNLIADPDRFAQVVTNLISNAVKFSPSGGTVSIDARRQGAEKVRISVADEGSGIAAEFKDRIFQKFAQADSTDSRQKGGTGLGLSIVKELVERMGGTVGFVSEEGRGTTFYFDIPAQAAVSSGKPPGVVLGRMDDEPVTQILHVDDDADTLRLVASAFEGRAIVHSSPSLEEARAAILRYDFDAVILDVAMPEGNGLDLVEVINHNEGAGPPIVLYTALDEEAPDEAVIFARLTKSKASLSRLVRTVEQAIGKGARAK